MADAQAPRFEARLSGRPMRIMGAAVSYLARIGKNILFEASPGGVRPGRGRGGRAGGRAVTAVAHGAPTRVAASAGA